MEELGTTISYYMLGGKTRGCIRCTRKVWSIICYKIPRAVAGACNDMADLRKSGIYFLLGYDDNDEPTVYVGQGARRQNQFGVLSRMLEPHSGTMIDGWTEGVVLISKSDELGATELCYLEHSFHRLVSDAKRARLLNGQSPVRGNLSEEEESDMLEYIEQAKVMLRALGYNFLVPVESSSGKGDAPEGNETDSSPLYLYAAGEIKATGLYTADGFVVFKDSVVKPDIVKSCPKSIRALREKYRDSIRDNKLVENLVFNSPSAAAGFIIGGSINGWDNWKSAAGKTLKETEREKNTAPETGDEPE